MCARTGLASRPLERRNPSQHRRYADYYDDELIARVGDVYELFGYAFGA